MNPFLENDSVNQAQRQAIDDMSKISAWRDAKTAVSTIFFLLIISFGLLWWFHGKPPIVVPKPDNWFFTILIVGPASLFSWPLFYRSYYTSRNWLNSIGMLIVSPIFFISVISIMVFAYTHFSYMYDISQKNKKLVNNVYTQFAPGLENYYQTNRRYPGNFCDINNSNVSCSAPPTFICMSEIEIANCTHQGASQGDTDHQTISNIGGSPKIFTYSTTNLKKGYKLCYKTTCVSVLNNKKQ